MIKPSPKLNQLVGTVIMALLMLSALAVSGFSLANMDQPANPNLAPRQVPVSQLVNVIRKMYITAVIDQNVAKYMTYRLANLSSC